MNDTQRPQDTEHLLRETFIERSRTFYPDGTPAPELPLDSASVTHITSRSQSRRGPLLMVAASATILAVALGFTVKSLSERNTQVNLNQAASSTPTSSDNTGPALPSHMTADHDGPVLVVGYPISCPGATDDARSQRSPSTPTNPIEFCKKLNLMGEVDPDTAVVTALNGRIFLEDTRPLEGATPSPLTDEEKEEEKKDILPAGVTFTGSDYEVSLAIPRVIDPLTGKCRPFSDVQRDVSNVLKNVSGGTWTSRLGNRADDGDASSPSCASIRFHTPTRTLTVYKPFSPEALDPATPLSTNDLMAAKNLEQFEAKVNEACLDLAAATKLANQASKSAGVPGLHTPAVLFTVNNGKECAKMYPYPENINSYIVFGQ